jgi:hypothetical protein
MIAEILSPRRRALQDGERIEGVVSKLPEPGSPNGNYLHLVTHDTHVPIPATAKLGWTVLHRKLERQAVHVGDRITIVFVGWRERTDGLSYRLVLIERAPC